MTGFRAACLTGAVLAGALLVTRASASPEAELEGTVRDARGRPVAGADVVVTDAKRIQRRTAVTDDRGRFLLHLPSGQFTVLVFQDRGATVGGRRVVLVPGARAHVEVTGAGIGPARALIPLATGQVVPVVPGDGGGRAVLLRERDVGGLVAAEAGGAPATPATQGPTLLGIGNGEIGLRLDGFDLRDPIGGGAPWELPLALFGAAAGGPDRSGAGGPAWGFATLHLGSRPGAYPRALDATALGGLAAGVSPRRGGGRPQGMAGTGAVEAHASGLGADGRLSLSLSVAPTAGAWRDDPESPHLARARRPLVVPALARVDAHLGEWRLALTALGARGETDHGRPARVLPVSARDTLTRDLGFVALQAGRPLGQGPSSLTIAASALGTRRVEQPLEGPAARERGGRATLGVDAVTGIQALGRHRLRAGAGILAAAARRPGARAGLGAAQIVENARASSWAAWLDLDERWEPVRPVELELGLALERRQFSWQSRANAARVKQDASTGLLVAPRARLALLDRTSGSGISVMGGRFGAPLPLGPFLGGAAVTSGTLDPPAEDVGVGGAELRRGGLALALTGWWRRTVDVIEDRSSPATGLPELSNPAGLRRDYRALVLQGVSSTPNTLASLAVVRSWLRGNHDGFTDPVTGGLRPGTTGAWDGPDVVINRQGALAADRPWSLRGAIERRWTLARWQAGAGAAGRLDAGTPVSALARSGRSGEGQVYLVQRGALGRTPWSGTLDAVLRVSRLVPVGRLTVALEGFNLLNFRTVTARDQIYTSEAAMPVAGGRRQDLSLVRGPQGEAVAPRAAFLSGTGWTEPRLVRLLLRLEL